MIRLFSHFLHLARSGADFPVGTPAVLRAAAAGSRLPNNLQPGRSAGRVSGRLARRPEFAIMHRGLRRALLLAAALLAAFTFPDAAVAASSYGKEIPNVATLRFTLGGTPAAVNSNTVTFTVRTPATIEFLKYAPQPESNGEAVPVPATYYDAGGGTFILIPPPPPAANPTVPLLGSPTFYLGEMLYLRLTDYDQNLDPTLAETVIVTVSCVETGDVEVLRFTESSPDTGVFVGYLPSTAGASPPGDGKLQVEDSCHLNARYTDASDGTDITADAALVDPYGFVFDSVSGEVVNGATVTLIDVATGQPAQVFGDDGISIFQPGSDPAFSTATVVTGGTATDSSGALYNLPDGGFRFPYVLPGTYRLAVTPPEGYTMPSVVTDAQILVVRPGAILTTGSRGEPFNIDPGPAVRIDVPVDPAHGDLWLQKDVTSEQASVGDFLQYRLTLENNSTATVAPGIVISDHLPLGFRYQKGSTRIDGARTADPTISADGRILSFAAGDLGSADTRQITYVVEVAAGAKTGKAVNRAQAHDSRGTVSNQARATVEIREQFFRDRAILLGRVLAGSCDQEDTGMEGLPGVRLYLEDGSYVITDKKGRYHFEGVEPGVHVVQVDLATLPPGYGMIPCEETSQFAGRTFSQFVDLQGGTLWRVNFYAAPLPPPAGEVSLQMSSTLAGEIATLRLEVRALTVLADNLRLTVMLPGTAEYLPGTARQDGNAIADPTVTEGTVTLRTPYLAAGESTVFFIQTRLGGNSHDADLPVKALLTFNTPGARNQRTPLAENRFRLAPGISKPGEEIRLYPRFPTLVAQLQPADLEMLGQLARQLKGQPLERIEVVGHTDDQRIAPHNRHLFADNQALSEARARSIADFLRQHLDLPPGSITARGMGESMPVADNASEEGRAQNRRVELHLVTSSVATPPLVEVTQAESGLKSITTTGAAATIPEAKTARAVAPPAAKPPNVTQQWLATLPGRPEILWPAAGFVPEIASTTILVQHPRGSQVELRVNGTLVDPLDFDTSKPVPNSEFVLSNWEGVDLQGGLNRIEAIVSANDSQAPLRLERELWFTSVAEKVALLPDQSILVADGIQPPLFALRVTDLAGHPLHPGQQLEFRVAPPYLALRDETIEDLAASAGTGTMIIGADGLAYAQLEPTTRTGEAIITIPTADKPLEIRAWLKPMARDWILVGFAEGTVGYNTINDNLVSAREAGIDEDGYTDGRVKFFAKGAIKGEWLLTLAYDSDKPDLDGDSLRQIIDPDTYYPLYGDETSQGYEAASARDLYVKLERDQFYALFGDMETGLNKTVLSAYSRSLNGLKSELQSERVDFTVFMADTRQAFVKEELRGDGTSGRYALSQGDLVINSEEVVIETRDRLHNERTLSEEPLSRHVDYDIDYNDGTLFFKRPIPSRDRDFNPVYLVVRYETRGSSGANLNYGGRVAVKSLDQRIEVGGSLVHEESGAAEGDLYGGDVALRLTPETTLRAEVAVSDVETVDDDRQGDAYLVEIAHAGETVDGRAWFRQQDAKFGLGQQSDGTDGMRTYGAQGAWFASPRWSLAGELWHEDNLSTDAQRDVAALETRYRTERYGLMVGLREARDRFEDGEKQTSRQLLLGGDWNTPDGRLTLRATHEQSLGGSNANLDFPTRTLIGADYRISKAVSLFAEQEFTWGDAQDTEGTRVGLRATPWQGGEVSSTVEQQIDENGRRIFALFGLGQSWRLNQNWSVDITLDRSDTIKNEPDGERVNPDVPTASGDDDDFTAVSVGTAYRAERWSWWNRLETRQGDSEDKVGISSGLVGEVRDGVAVSARLMAFITDASGGVKRDEEEITLGLAYRPDRSRWILLERLDLSLYNEDGDGEDSDGMRIVNHFHANFRTADRRWQTSFYYGLKFVRENFDGDRYDGYTDMIAVETRYNLTSRCDVGLHGAVLHSWNSDQFDYSLGADVGYLVMTNAWLSAGYNIVGFEDEDFADAGYTADGPYVRFRMKFDQQSVRDAAEWLSR